MKKPLLFAALSRRVAGITDQAQLYFDTIRRTPVVVTPAGESLPMENRSAKGVAGGYPSLDSSTLIPVPQLGVGTPDGTKFLRDDRTWAVPAGGGTTNHSLLTSLGWSASGHTGTADRLAGFSGAGAAVAASVTAPLVYSGGALSVSVFTGDSGTGGATGVVPAPLAGDGAMQKYLCADGTWAQMPSGLVTFYLDSTDASDISGYKTALTSPSTAAEATLTVGATGTGDNLLASFATEPGVPGTTLLPHGINLFHFHVATGASNQIGRLKLEIYTCASDGSSETLRASSYSDNFWDASQELNTSVELTSGYTLATTDRLVFKLYGARVSGPATCNITVYTCGTTRAASVLSTLGALTPAIIGAQPLDSDLTAYAALATTGLVARTGAGTVAARTLTQPAAGITVSNGDGVSGNPTLALADDLAALEGLSSTGIAVRTGSATWAQRTVTSSDSTVTITNPGGVAGNIDLSASGISAVAAVASSIPCGCGVAGDVTFDGTTSVTGFGAPSSRIYTCPTGPEIEYDDVTIDTTGGDVTIIPAGVLIRARTVTITGSGTVTFRASGSNASGTTAGAGAAVATSSMFYAGVSGASGRTTSTGGAAGGGVTSAGSVSFGRDGLVGADCKDGITVRAGGTAGNASRNYVTTPNTYGSLPQFATNGALYLNTSSARSDYIAYGAPAHGGSAAQLGAGGSANSGGGGGSGCPQVWCIGTLDTGTATLIIDSSGGTGANATTSVNAAAGGGSGGNASLAMLFVNAIRGSVAVQVKSNGGNGGNGSMVGTGVYANGGPGGHGNYAVILYGSAVTTPTATATAGTSGTPVGVGYAALGTPVAGTTIVTRLT